MIKKMLRSTVGWPAGIRRPDDPDHSGGEYRTEHDSIGERKVPADAYYGVQTLRAAENFMITGLSTHPELINHLVLIKKAAAITNARTGQLDQKIADAITAACDEILEGGFREHFVVDPVQGGAGTSLNMNANEVIANRAIELLGGQKGDYSLVHPNDHVNMSQSTNDVIPTAGRMAAVHLLMNLRLQLKCLQIALSNKAVEFDHVVKMGRTQMQDAVPIRMGQEFRAYADAIERCEARIETVTGELKHVNMGGTAIGTAVNADEDYLQMIVPVINEVSGMEFIQADDLIDSTQNLDPFVAVSGAVKACAVAMSKIANDLRLMSSGPQAGFGEIHLPSMQNGSSIMPGKVNPVIPEVVNQVAFNVIGNDVTITLAAEAGQLELNAFEPIVFYNLFQSIDTLGSAAETFADNCISGIAANEERCLAQVENSVMVATALAPVLGYERAADIAKEALEYGRSVRDLVREKGLMDDEELERVLDPYSMTEARCTKN